MPPLLSVSISAPSIRIGSLKSGTLTFSLVLEDDGMEIIQFTCSLHLSLPGAKEPAVLALTVGVNLEEESADLTASLGPEVISQDAAPVWPNVFGLNGFDVYYIDIGVGFLLDAGVPDEIDLGIKVGFDVDDMLFVLEGDFVISPGQTNEPRGGEE